MPKRSALVALCVWVFACSARAQPLPGDLTQALNMPPQQMADMVLPGLGKAMGLPPRQSVVVRETDRAALREMLLGVMSRQYPGASLKWLNIAYEAIGLLPPGSDLRSAALDLYQGQIAGYYDPALHQMALVRGATGMEQAQVLQHELAHALQDQHFGLQNLLMAVAADDDQALALQAVVEGQAVLAMYVGATSNQVPGVSDDNASSSTGNEPALTAEAVRQQLKDAGMEVSDSELQTLMGGDAKKGKRLSLSSLMVPATPLQPGQLAYLQAQLLFPYQEGAQFIEALLDNASFPAVIRRTLEHPPRATRYILHPELYTPNAMPLRVTLPHMEAIPGTTRAYHTTVGELNVRTLLGGAGVGDAQAKSLVGDHLVALQAADGPCVAWISVWESVASAQGFAAFMGAHAGPKLVKRMGMRVGTLTCAKGPTWDAAVAALTADLKGN